MPPPPPPPSPPHQAQETSNLSRNSHTGYGPAYIPPWRRRTLTIQVPVQDPSRRGAPAAETSGDRRGPTVQAGGLSPTRPNLQVATAPAKGQFLSSLADIPSVSSGYLLFNGNASPTPTQPQPYTSTRAIPKSKPTQKPNIKYSPLSSCIPTSRQTLPKGVPSLSTTTTPPNKKQLTKMKDTSHKPPLTPKRTLTYTRRTFHSPTPHLSNQISFIHTTHNLASFLGSPPLHHPTKKNSEGRLK